MKRLLRGIFLFMLCLGINLSSSRAQEAVGPRMVLEGRIFELKEVDEGEVIEHDFKVLNVGDKPLMIQKVKPG